MRWSDVSFSDRTVRQFAGLWIVFLTLLAVWQGILHGRTTAGIILAILAISLGPLGLWRPAIMRPVYVAAMVVSFPIGWVISHVVLAVLFYGLFTPIALLFRLIGRDALKRQFAVEDSSYWSEKPPQKSTRQYFRQY